MKKRLLSTLLTLCMVLTLLPMTALAGADVGYWNPLTETMGSIATTVDIATNTSLAMADGEWYYVPADATITNRITVTGDVNLILGDNATLTASAGIQVEGTNSLTIWAQSTGAEMGKLNVTCNITNAAIGGNGGTGTGNGGDGGTITINGGYITASAGSGASGGAGIGGGNGGNGGTITINGGTVAASADYGAGIGGGQGGGNTGGSSYKSGDGGAGGTIIINGGTVTASSTSPSSSSAGIGGGGMRTGGNGGNGNGGNGGSITIIGSDVTASAACGAGIGGGAGHTGGDGGIITIIDSNVTASSTSTFSHSAGIGGGGGDLENYGGSANGGDGGDGGTITITGSTVTASTFYGAGIGGGGGCFGEDSHDGGKGGDGDNITITDSNVTASSTSTFSLSAGIGGGGGGNGGYGGIGGDGGDGGTIAISGGNVKASSTGGTGIGGGDGGLATGSGTAGTNGVGSTGTIDGNAVIYTTSLDHDEDDIDGAIIFEGAAGAEDGTVYGDVDLQDDLTVTSTQTLNIPTGNTLKVPSGVTLTNNGTITNDGTVTGSGTFTNNGTIDGANTYTVTYKPNGGSPSDQTVTLPDGVSHIVLGNIFTRGGYTFNGWNTADDGTGTPYAGGETLTTSTTLYAQWTETTYAVTVTDSYAALTGAGDYPAGATVNIDAGTRSGYTFSGWTINSGGVTLANASSAATTFTMPATTVSVTAKWRANSSPNTPSSGGGTATVNSISPATAAFDKAEGSANNKDIVVTLTIGSGSLSAIQNGTMTLVEGTDYTKNGNTYTIKASYLETLPTGTATLTFDMSSGADPAITITIAEAAIETPTPTPELWANPFGDVNERHWFYEDVKYVCENGLFAGTSATTYSPQSPMTRAMVFTVLARLAGVETVGGETWYSLALEWGVETGLTDGLNPNGNVTREQLVTLLWRYAGSPSVSAELDGFSDADSLSDWAAEAMAWAVSIGIIRGNDSGELNPNAGATRAEVAAILHRFMVGAE